jgi:hypothetical protein
MIVSGILTQPVVGNNDVFFGWEIVVRLKRIWNDDNYSFVVHGCPCSLCSNTLWRAIGGNGLLLSELKEYLNAILSKDLYRGFVGNDAYCCLDLFYASLLRLCSEYGSTKYRILRCKCHLKHPSHSNNCIHTSKLAAIILNFVSCILV